MKFIAIGAIACLAVTPGLCADNKQATKSNFSEAIQKYLASTPGPCFTPPAPSIPFEIPAKDLQLGIGPTAQARADALVEAGLLVRSDAQVKGISGKVPGFKYTISDAGQKLLVKGAGKNLGAGDAFCAGKYKVLEVVLFTEPADMLGAKVSRVTYRYTVDGAPSWAQLPSIRKAFPEAAKETTPDAKANAVLVLTSEGWMHERLVSAGR